MKNIHKIKWLRRQHALTQGELAELIALCQTGVSRLERVGEPGTLETAFALQVVFDVEPRYLLPNYYAAAEDAVMGRAAELDRKLAGRTDPESVKKQRLLAMMVERARPAAEA